MTNTTFCCNCLDDEHFYAITFYKGSSYCKECLIKIINSEQSKGLLKEGEK
jgi:hypothetical protein